MDKDTAKQLRIKTGILKRSVKEYEMYLQEVENGEKELASMEETHDRYRQLQQALEESKTMVADTQNRVGAAKEELEQLYESENLAQHFADDELVKQAKELMDKATSVI